MEYIFIELKMRKKSQSIILHSTAAAVHQFPVNSMSFHYNLLYGLAFVRDLNLC